MRQDVVTEMVFHFLQEYVEKQPLMNDMSENEDQQWDSEYKIKSKKGKFYVNKKRRKQNEKKKYEKTNVRKNEEKKILLLYKFLIYIFLSRQKLLNLAEVKIVTVQNKKFIIDHSRRKVNGNRIVLRTSHLFAQILIGLTKNLITVSLNFQ